MTAPQPPKTLTGKRAGIVGALVLCSASMMALRDKWEDGANADKGGVVYADKLARNLPTACRGITHHVTDEPVIVGDFWSKEKCDRVARVVTEKGQIDLAECFEVRLTQNQFDAFSVMAHNAGVPDVCASVAVGLMNAGMPTAACRAMAYRPDGSPNWSYVGKTFVRGLHNRRLDEMNLCLKP